MENTLTKPLSKLDAKIVASFKKFITEGTDAETLRRSLTSLYVAYTRMLVISASQSDGAFVWKQTDTELYYLSELIEILDGGYD